MIVPQYWAESRVQYRQKGRQITVRRFGWSDTSQAAAQTNADERAKEALRRLISGEKLIRREPKIPYNGAIGLPIRQEIVSRHGETIITRNSYGARCLNTPNVLFADIDFENKASFRFILGVFVLLLLGAIVAGALTSPKLGVVLAILALLSSSMLANALRRILRWANGGAERDARRRIAGYVEEHPDWNVRIYRTPAGLRILATHRTFSPSDPKVIEFFRALRADPLYTTMCLNQQCFRARVSPKPWRIGIIDHLKPRPGTWPVVPDRMPMRNAWIARYEAAAASFASCTLVETIGSGITDPDASCVQELHDEMCRANSQLPIA